jgi:hypothetical protein
VVGATVERPVARSMTLVVACPVLAVITVNGKTLAED